MESLKLKLLKSLQQEQKLETKIRDREELEYKENTLPFLYIKLHVQRNKTKEFVNQIAGVILC